MTVTLHYSCLPPSAGNIIVSLDENGVQSGDFIPGATWDGQNHSVSVIITGLLTPGTAAGQAMIENTTGSASASTNAGVVIK